jgi:hypothetical protein
MLLIGARWRSDGTPHHQIPITTFEIPTHRIHDPTKVKTNKTNPAIALVIFPGRRY